MRLRCSNSFRCIGLALLLTWGTAELSNAQGIDVIADNQLARERNADQRGMNARRWIRGLIQSELDAIDSVCDLTQEQRQRFVDTAEGQWKFRLTTAIRGYAESNNVRSQVDFEDRVEKLLAVWASEILHEEQYTQWLAELTSRQDFRKRLVIGRMVEASERRLRLTSQQMEQVAETLASRWKDSWWSMYRAGNLPEAKFAWISNILNETQRTTGEDRTSARQESFISSGVVDLPSKSLNERFEIAGVRSGGHLPLIDAKVDQASGGDDVRN